MTVGSRRGTRPFWWIAVALVLVWGGAEARSAKKPQPQPSEPYQAVVLVEAESGRVLFEQNAHVRRPPASMTKMMVMLIAAEQVRDGRMHWNDPVRTSKWASRMGGSQVYLREGEVFPLGEMMKAITIHSANDAAVAVAEAVAGSTPAFVELMNQHAKALGLTDTEYHSPHGLPPARGQEPDLSSAFDLAMLARELIKYPDIMKWASTAEAPFRDGQFQLVNTNKLVRRTSWIDGLKTGYYHDAGFNVTATGEQNGIRLITVVMGAPTKKECFDEAAKLLSSGFARYTAVFAVHKGDVVAQQVPVRSGNPGVVRIVAGGEFKTLVEKSEKPSFTLELAIPAALEAPLKPAARVGEVVVKNDGREVGRVPALTAEGIERQKTLWERLF